MMNIDVDTQTLAMLLLRHAAGYAAGFALAHGWANGYTSEQIASAIVLLGTIGFSFAQKDGVSWLKAEKARLEKLLAIYQKQTQQTMQAQMQAAQQAGVAAKAEALTPGAAKQ